ncbi:MAG: hypothetical protein AAF587_24670 [Bacteroidota bacterium]
MSYSIFANPTGSYKENIFQSANAQLQTTLALLPSSFILPHKNERGLIAVQRQVMNKAANPAVQVSLGTFNTANLLCTYTFRDENAGFNAIISINNDPRPNTVIEFGHFSGERLNSAKYHRVFFEPKNQERESDNAPPVTKGLYLYQTGDIIKGNFSTHTLLMDVAAPLNGLAVGTPTLNFPATGPWNTQVNATTITTSLGIVAGVQRALFIFSAYAMINSGTISGCNLFSLAGAPTSPGTVIPNQNDVFNPTTSISVSISLTQANITASGTALKQAILGVIDPTSTISLVADNTLGASQFIFNNFTLETTTFR